MGLFKKIPGRAPADGVATDNVCSACRGRGRITIPAVPSSKQVPEGIPEAVVDCTFCRGTGERK